MKVIFFKDTFLRSPEYQINTKIVSDKKNRKLILKESTDDRGIANIIRIQNAYESYKDSILAENVKLSEMIEKGFNFFTSEFVDGENMDAKLTKLLMSGEKEIFLEQIKSYYDFLHNSFIYTDSFNPNNSAFCEFFCNSELDLTPIFSKKCFTVSNLDLNFDNIIRNSNSYYIIDYEWIFNFSVPVDYIFYKALMTYQHKHCELNISKEIGTLFEIFSINEKDTFVYQHLIEALSSKVHFYKNVNYLRPILYFNYSKPVEHLSSIESRNTDLTTKLLLLTRRNDELESRISNLSTINCQQSTELSVIHSSGGWKLLTILYKIRDKLFPQRSLRRKVALKIKNLTVNKN